jgi:hypothetical protein
MPHDASYIAASDLLPWSCAPAAGVSYKTLRYDRETGAGAVLIHMTPTTQYPRHRALAGMDVLVLDGDVQIQGERLGRGDFIHLPAGSQQAPVTASGCVLYATFGGRVENLHADPGIPV